MDKTYEIYITVDAPDYQTKTIEKQIAFAIQSHTDIKVNSIQASQL